MKIDRLIAEASPLPWEQNLKAALNVRIVQDGRERGIASTGGYSDTVGDSLAVNEANAALIAHLSKVAPLYRELVLDKQKRCNACGYTDKDKDLLSRIEELES